MRCNIRSRRWNPLFASWQPDLYRVTLCFVCCASHRFDQRAGKKEKYARPGPSASAHRLNATPSQSPGASRIGKLILCSRRIPLPQAPSLASLAPVCARPVALSSLSPAIPNRPIILGPFVGRHQRRVARTLPCRLEGADASEYGGVKMLTMTSAIIAFPLPEGVPRMKPRGASVAAVSLPCLLHHPERPKASARQSDYVLGGKGTGGRNRKRSVHPPTLIRPRLPAHPSAPSSRMPFSPPLQFILLRVSR